MKQKKKPKKRAKHYEKKLKIHSTFDEAIKALVLAEPNNKPKK